jgi:alkanesulfonate monooxygenase SsuD/methylene tetrahydromethanopterin reductase-like flavin-dependent oxidoreductase (luciferase family)
VIFHPKFPPETLADYARRAEAAGFEELWLWDDCFLPGAFTSAAIALSATQQLKVGIGLLPVPAYHPLFAAMEITTLARAFPDRILPGFGHGVERWMAQIGAAQRSPMKALNETVTTVRQLLSGETVTMHGEWVHLDQVQMQLTPETAASVYVERYVKDAATGRAGGRWHDPDSMSSPAYLRWALSHSCWNGRNRATITGLWCFSIVK